jgi:hypothetical protein
MIGLAAAFFAEFLDRRIRGVDDLANMLQLPVLAVIRGPQPVKGAARLGIFRARAALPGP